MKRLSLLVLAVCGLFLSQGSASAVNLNFTLKNSTGSTITGVYISPHSQDRWGYNVLSTAIDDGDVVSFRAPTGATSRYWDLKVIYSNGTSEEWQNGFNLGRIYSITLYYDEEGTAQAYYTYASS
jgi:hypothetical protein